MDVMISVTGVQRTGAECDTVELTTAGRLESTEQGFRLWYRESAAGMDGVITSLEVDPSRVLLERTGKVNSLLVLEKGRRHTGSYETPYGTIAMGVYTQVLENRLCDRGGDLHVAYTLDIDAGMVSSHDVRIAIKMPKS